MDKKKKIIILILILILFSILIWWFFNNKNKMVLIDHQKYIHSKYTKEISPDKLPLSKEGIKFTYTFWLYLKNIPENANWETKYNTHKYIIYRFGSPDVVYFPKKNVIRIFMTYKNELSDVAKDYIDITDISIQKWNQIGIVLDEKNFDIYLNGELYGSILLSNVPFIYQRFMLVGHKNANFNGHISKLIYYNDSLDYKVIYDKYQQEIKDLPEKMDNYSKEYINNKKDN